VDAERLIPLFFADRFGSTRKQHSGVVHQNVDALKSAADGVDQLFDAGRLADVGWNGQAAWSHLRGRRVELPVVPPADENVGAFAGERHSAGASNPASASGDDGHFARQTHSRDSKRHSHEKLLVRTEATRTRSTTGR